MRQPPNMTEQEIMALIDAGLAFPLAMQDWRYRVLPSAIQKLRMAKDVEVPMKTTTTATAAGTKVVREPIPIKGDQVPPAVAPVAEPAPIQEA